MFKLGFDCHKAFSQVAILDEKGAVVKECRLVNQRAALARFVRELAQPVQAVIEAGYNWGLMYDLLTELGVDVRVAHPLRVKAIASAQIKTDTIDARTLGRLLHARLIPEIYVPSPDIRRQKDILRQRCWLVKMQTAVKNRIHQLLARNHIENPGFTDLFGLGGMKFLRSLALGTSDQQLLTQDLELYDLVHEQVKIITHWIGGVLQDNRYRTILLSLPGLGAVLAALAALEIAAINRFTSPGKLTAYAGLVPTTYASGGKVHHGDLLPQCNRYLRYAFVEAAWSAVKSSPYCRALFAKLRKRKGANTAIIVVARRLCGIAYLCLKENRLYEERAYDYDHRV